MTPLLYGLGALLTVLLAAFALVHYAVALLFVLNRPPQSGASGSPAEHSNDGPSDAITVLVPARNEGEGVVRALRSLIDQDHAGPIEIALLLKDRTDTSLPFLSRAFGGEFGADGDVELTQGGRLRVVVHFTGHDPKHDKVNWMASRLATPFAAILDADHIAKPDWVSTSIAMLVREQASLVQGHREPISAQGLFGLWDSLHQHIGCEVTNVAYRHLGLTIFFTGTTAVMSSELLRSHPLRDCLTEDTDLSYGLVMEGQRLLYNPTSGSVEEVSPDLYSFLARRRRWASGHTEAFFRHLPALLGAPIGWSARLQFLFHGVHYLVALAVFVVHALVGLAFALRLPDPALAAALTAGAVLALSLSMSQPTRGWMPSLSVFTVLFVWLTPAVILFINLVLALMLGDASRALLPVANWLHLAGLFGFVSPLVVLLVGLAGFRQLGVGSALAVTLSYPLAFYLDVSGVLIGLVDYVWNRRIWLAVARAPAPESGPLALGIRDSWRLGAVMESGREYLLSDRSMLMNPSRLIPALFLVAVVVGGVILALPATQIPVDPRDCEALEHDGHPWIVPPGKLANYCGPKSQMGGFGTRTGSFSPLYTDEFTTVSGAYWDKLDDTFDCNLARFQHQNLSVNPGGGLDLQLRPQVVGDRNYTSASIATKNVPEAKYLFGRFEVEMQPAKADGVLTAFFLYRFDPWQEIDLEFVGKDTTKMLVNVYYNPGEEGDLYNYGYRGTPVLIDLGFDAADAVHRYAIEWDPGEIRWFVDDVLVHARPSGSPTPVPHLPMRFHINTWPICSEELAGKLDPTQLPVQAHIDAVHLFSWSPPPFETVSEQPGGWRSDAGWIQPGR